MIPKYTFLLPAYKATYFEKALLSIKNLSFKEFNVIVSDDSSPEDLKGIYDRTVGDDSRFLYRRNDVNMGGKSLVSHWNLLVGLCNTEFVIMASDDDVYESTFLDEIDKLTVKYPNVNLFRGRTKIIGENDELQLNDQLYPEIMDQAHFFYVCFSNSFISCEPNYCYRTNTLKTKGKYVDFPSAWFSDDATHLVMAENGCATTKNVVFGFRNSGISISKIWMKPDDARKKVEASLAFNRWIDSYYPSIKQNEERALLGIAYGKCKSKIKSNLENNIQFCNFSSFKILAKRAQHELLMSFPVLLYNWIRTKKHLMK